MAEYTLIMQAVVSLKDGDTLVFTPGIASKTSDDLRWARFCRDRDGELCTLLGAETPSTEPTSAGAIEVFMNNLKGPRFHVRFNKDGHERGSMNAIHFTLPQIALV